MEWEAAMTCSMNLASGLYLMIIGEGWGRDEIKACMDEQMSARHRGLIEMERLPGRAYNLKWVA